MDEAGSLCRSELQLFNLKPFSAILLAGMLLRCEFGLLFVAFSLTTSAAPSHASFSGHCYPAIGGSLHDFEIEASLQGGVIGERHATMSRTAVGLVFSGSRQNYYRSI